MLGPQTRPRTRSVDTSLSLSPEDKQLIPYFLQKRNSISIKPQFNNELIGESIQPKHYLTSEQREAYRITCKDGFFYDASGNLLDGPVVYVLFPDDRLYGAPVSAKLNHSYLSSGLDLKGAGILYPIRGRLVTVSNESGHYKPTLNEMRDALLWFCQQNLNQPILFEDHSQLNKALEFIGIRYFHAFVEAIHSELEEPQLGLDLIANKDLVSSMTILRRKALEVYDTINDDAEDEMEKWLLTLKQNSDNNGQNGVYFSELSGSEDKSNIEKQKEDNNIFNRIELLLLTCLQNSRVRDEIFSRFNGVLKISI